MSKQGRGKAKAGRIPGRLTARDVELLIQTYKFRYLSTSQVTELLFPSRTTALRRLQFLSTNGYLQKFNIPGIADSIFALDADGVEVVADAVKVEVSALGWSRKTSLPKDPWFMRHFLEVGWFRIGLTKELLGHPDVQLLGFIPEYIGEKRKKGGVDKYLREVISDIRSPSSKLSHTPDGVFAVRRKSREIAFFLEIDRGTEVISNESRGVLKALTFYLNLLEGEGFQKYAPKFGLTCFSGAVVLFLTTSAKRIDNIRQVLKGLNPPYDGGKRLLWFASLNVVKNREITKKVFVCANSEDSELYGFV